MIASKRITGVPALRIVGRVFLGLGAAGLAVAAVAAAVELTGPRTTHTVGTVTSVSNSRAWVRFKTEDGREVGFRGSVRASSWEEGDRTAVVFDPKQPADAAIDGIAGRWFLTFLFGILGGVFATVGIGLTIGGRLAARPPTG